MSKLLFLITNLLFFSLSLSASNKYAIIVGVNDYDSLTDLKAGVNDAEKMASYYKGLGFKIWLMSDRQETRFEKPSLLNLERTLENIKEISEGQTIDELVIFFAGHGVQIKRSNYLCFPETDITKNIGMLSVDNTLVPWIRDLNAELTMVYLDACRNDLGPMRAAGVERGMEIVGYDKKVNGGDVAIFYAAKPGSFSYEKPDGSNGFFTDTLIEALQSPQTTSISDLYSYIRTALPERTESAYGRPQIPNLGGDFDLTVSFTKGQVDLGVFDTSAKLFVEGSESGATIKINGIVRGKTPLLLESLNPGIILVEVEKDGLYGSTQINLVAKAFERINIKLTKVTGDILVDSLVTYDASNKKNTISNIPDFMDNLDVWVDGRNIGKHSSSLISSLEPGARDIVIKGDGWYWEDRVTIRPNNAKKISVELGAVGDLSIVTISGVKVKMENVTDGYEIITDESMDMYTKLPDMPTGAWRVSVIKKGYETHTELIEILKGQKLTISPELEYNRETKINNELASLNATNIVLNKNYNIGKKANTSKWISRGIGSGLIGAAGYFVYSAFDSYTQYEAADTEVMAAKLREDSTMYINIGLGAAISGVIGWVIPVFFSTPKTKELKPQIELNEIRIQELETELKELD